MSSQFDPGDALIFMKIGTHAGEPLEEIIDRKRQEISDAGFAMWGYGGNTCHPITVVQPFASSRAREGRIIRLCMRPMKSHHIAAKVRAEKYSADRVRWEPVPSKINVLGSRYALCIGSLEPADLALDLEQTIVGVGNSRGRRGSGYIKGRVDKACLDVVAEPGSGDHESVPIEWVADVVEPYAVLLQN